MLKEQVSEANAWKDLQAQHAETMLHAHMFEVLQIDREIEELESSAEKVLVLVSRFLQPLNVCAAVPRRVRHRSGCIQKCAGMTITCVKSSECVLILATGS